MTIKWVRTGFLEVVACGSLIVGWSVLVLVRTIAAPACRDIGFLLFPLLLLSLCSLIASVVAALRYGKYWLIATLAAIVLLFQVLGTFEPC
jgi:hypothetical protein